jgi:hypothetical protein
VIGSTGTTLSAVNAQTPQQQGNKWLRQAQVIVGKNGDGNVSPSNGLLISSVQSDGSPGLRITFDIQKTIYRTPNQALIKVYNLTQAHEKQIDAEYNDLIVQCGYVGQGAMRLVFRGNIRFTHFYREGNDHVGEINAGDGDKDFRNAIVNFTLQANHSDADVMDKLLETMQATIKGHIAGKNINRKRIRGKTHVGLARDVMDRIAKENDGHWSSQDGALTMIPVDSVVSPAQAIEISSETGLLETPEVNDKGITIKVMLDPRIVAGGKLWLKNNDVKMKHLSRVLTGQSRKAKGPKTPVRLDPDGVYKVFAVRHVGDTCGGDWYSECRCVGLSQPIPSSKGMPVSTTPDGDLL